MILALNLALGLLLVATLLKLTKEISPYAIQWYVIVHLFVQGVALAFYQDTYLWEVDSTADTTFHFVVYMLFALATFKAICAPKVEAFRKNRLSVFLLAGVFVVELGYLLFLAQTVDIGSELLGQSRQFKKRELLEGVYFIGSNNIGLLLLLSYGITMAVARESKLQLSIACAGIAVHFINLLLLGNHAGGFILALWILSVLPLTNHFTRKALNRNLWKVMPGLVAGIAAIFWMKLSYYSANPAFGALQGAEALWARLLAQGQVFYLDATNAPAFSAPSENLLTDFIEVRTLDYVGWVAEESVIEGSRLAGGYPASLVGNFGYLGGLVVLVIFGLLLQRLNNYRIRSAGLFETLMILLAQYWFLDFATQGDFADLAKCVIAGVVLRVAVAIRNFNRRFGTYAHAA